MCVEEVRNAALVLEGDECRLCSLVVARGEELPEADLKSASTPAVSGWDQARLAVAWHDFKLATQGFKSRQISKSLDGGSA
jgi:hypothetical protein